MPPPLDAARLKAANINPATGLATDYLNHYNEVAMSIASLGDLPEMRADVLAWRPLGYPAHFMHTGFADRGLAVAAYIAAPRDVKARFLEARGALDLQIEDVQCQLASGERPPAAIAGTAPAIFAGIARLGGLINGGKSGSLLQQSAEQDLVDSFFS